MASDVIKVPDLGGADTVEVIEISVAVGDQVVKEDTIVVLESDKATMEVPCPKAGVVLAVLIKEGDKLSQGDAILELDVQAQDASLSVGQEPQSVDAAPVKPAEPPSAEDNPEPVKPSVMPPEPLKAEAVSEAGNLVEVYAGPAVRQLARKLGVDLSAVKGSGQRNRIVKEDVEAFVKQSLNVDVSTTSVGSGIPAIPAIDFSQFGDVTEIPLTKIQKVTAKNMRRAWLNVPHVTQFDNADITDMEDFRQELKKEGEQKGIKLTPMAFLLLASARALRLHPAFNRSLSNDGQRFIQKDYVNIGIAVDTPKGLMVPVLKNADQKGLWDLAGEANDLAAKARTGKLKANEMKGGCFTVSSLGAIGGTGFTPIVNAPEVAILGVSKSTIQPVWSGTEFMPRMMMPLGLSYDHRALNGADAGKFLTTLVALLSDIRRLAL